MFIDLIRTVFFEKRLFVRVYWNTILVSSHGMAPLGNKSYREVTRLIVQVNYKIIFLPGALEMVFKEALQ